MKSKSFSIVDRFRSFKYAFQGFKPLFVEEHNSRIHLLATIVVTIAGIIFHLSRMEWIAIIFAIALVFSFELINSSIENVCDFISPDKHEVIKKVKDMAAAAVLVTSLAALLIGLIVFIPKVVALF